MSEAANRLPERMGEMMTQEQIAALLSPPDIFAGKKALCVQPHPDDNEVGMGGIIARLCQSGCEVHYLTVTNGDLGTIRPELCGEELAVRREQEVRKAGEVLGVSEYFSFALPDGSLNDAPALAGRIAELIRENQYDMLFAPDPWMPYEAHRDHVVTGQACAQAFISCSLPRYPRDTKTPPCAPFAIGFYNTNQVNTVVDITDTFETKFAAMAMHQSQFDERLLEMYRIYFSMRGQKLAAEKDFALGEGLRVMAPLHMHCFPDALEI